MPSVDEPGAQLAGGLVAPIGVAPRAYTGPVSRPFFERHDAHAGLGVAGEDRPLDRRRAAPARQQREVHVHEAVRHRVEQRLGQQLPERDDHAERRRRCAATSSTTSGRLLGRDAPASPSSSAAAFTGLGLGRSPRPRRRSGWVTTSAISWPAPCSARSDGTASAGVPKKTRRTIDRRIGAGLTGRGRAARARRRTVGAARELAGAHLAQRLAADVGLEPVEQEHAVEVVDLVLDHAGEQVVALEDDLVAVEVDARAW